MDVVINTGTVYVEKYSSENRLSLQRPDDVFPKFVDITLLYSVSSSRFYDSICEREMQTAIGL